MEHNQLILSAKDVNIQFNLRGKVLHAIRGIDLDLYQGEVLAIVGESGSGKSVFTKSFMGLLDANGSITSGTIDYYGMADGKPLRLSDLPEPAEDHRGTDHGSRCPASGLKGRCRQGKNAGIPAGCGHL